LVRVTAAPDQRREMNALREERFVNMDTALSSGGHAEHGVEKSAEEIAFNERKVRFGMFLYVLADVLFVIFMLVTYPWLRAYNTDNGWFPFAGMALPDQGTSLTLILLMVVSAAFFFLGFLGIRAGNQTILRVCMLFSWLLILAALIGQVKFMGAQQFAAADGTFADTWLLFSGYHIYHLLWAVFLGLGITIRSFHGKYTQAHHLGVVTIGYFWYWAALTPVIFYVLMALLPPK
jgi:heme/copper-type cytochrome/quinol oxidase subunit 3